MTFHNHSVYSEFLQWKFISRIYPKVYTLSKCEEKRKKNFGKNVFLEFNSENINCSELLQVAEAEDLMYVGKNWNDSESAGVTVPCQ